MFAQLYNESNNDARYKMLAQKLAQHLDNLMEDDRARLRWLWELVQNAKDAPNEFEDVRIKVKIEDNKFTFSHNGDPFKPMDLSSMVNQYSTKPEENLVTTETTGKYGTGFITTYLLSRSIRIKGLMKIKWEQKVEKEESQEEESSDSSDDEKGQGKPKNKYGEIKGKKVSSLKHQKKEVSKLSESSSEEQEQKEHSQFKYQKFDVYLDRSYTNREVQLVQKLKHAQQNLISDMQKGKELDYYDREVDHFDTQFIYLNLDECAHKMINEAVVLLKQLFPYALLFNPNITSFKLEDKRTNRIFDKFQFKIGKQSEFKNIQIREYQYIQRNGEEKTKETIHLAYDFSQKTRSTVAVPVKIQNKQLTILKVPPKLPKMFKEFPLIGCPETGYHFIFTSRLFYPNESRSDLFLKASQRKSTKPAKNWDILQDVFRLAQQLYLRLAESADKGGLNLLIASNPDYLKIYTQFNERYFGNRLQSFANSVLASSCIKFKNNQKGKLSNLIFIHESQLFSGVAVKNENKELFRIFSIIYEDNQILSPEGYSQIYDDIVSNLAYWNGKFKIVNLEGCLAQLSKLTFKKFVERCKDEDYAFQKLEQIYDYLSTRARHFISSNNRYQFKIYLSQSKEFGYISPNGSINPLLKKNLPPVFEKLNKSYFNIDICSLIIHPKFAKYIHNIGEYNFYNEVDLFKRIFQAGIRNTKNMGGDLQRSIGQSYPWMLGKKTMETFNENYFKHLISLLKTLQYRSPLFDFVLQSFKFTDKIPSLPLQVNEIAELSDFLNKTQLANLFTTTTVQMLSAILEGITWSQFLNFYLRFQQRQFSQFLKWFYQLEKLMNSLGQILPVSLAWNEKLIKRKDLSVLVKSSSHKINQLYSNYPSKQDVDIIRYLENIDLRSLLVHPQMADISTLPTKTFLDYFSPITSNVNEYNKSQKNELVEYLVYTERQLEQNLSDINEQRAATLKTLLGRRHLLMLQVIGDLSRDEQEYIYLLFKRRREIPAAKDILKTQPDLIKLADKLGIYNGSPVRKKI